MEPADTTINNDNLDRSAASRGVNQASTSAHEAIKTITDSARPAVDRLATSAHETVDRVAAVAVQTADSLGVKGDQLAKAQSKIAADTRDYVQEHPVAALGIAVAAGYLLSRLLSKR